MDYLLLLKPGDELLALGNSFTNSPSSHIQALWIQCSADLEAVWKGFDYHLLCFEPKLCFCFDWFEHPMLVFDGKFNICTFNCATRSTALCGGEKRIYNQSSWFEVVYFHPCFPVAAFLFSIGVPGCAGLSFTIKPPFPHPSARLPVSSPALPSPL